MCGIGLRSVGKVLLLLSLSLLVSLPVLSQEDVETMTTVELIEEALTLVDEQAKRLEKREASLELRENNLNQIEQSLLRIEQIANDYEQYSKSLEDENNRRETWNHILTGTTVASTTVAIVLFILR